MTPHDEAVQVFGEVVRELSSPARDLKLALRRCLHACQVLGWIEPSLWFQRQLVGYEAEAPLPAYRVVTGRTTWQTEAFPVHVSDTLRSVDPGYQAMRHLGDGTIVLELRDGIDWILGAAQNGYAERTGTAQKAPNRPPQSPSVEQVKIFDAYLFSRVVSQIEHETFAFTSARYAMLKYGNALTDLWKGYRLRIDETIGALNLSKHLEAIESGIQSDNPQEWRKSVFSCRNLMEDLASLLWQDTREVYDHLPGDGPGKKLKVSSDKYVNRLAAYLHQKGQSRNRGKFFRDELERLSASIRSLVAVQSEAHAAVSLDDARLVVLATYFVLGVLVSKTDMAPITTYQDPGA